MAMPIIANPYEIEAIIRARLADLLNASTVRGLDPDEVIGEADRIKRWAQEIKDARGATERAA